MVSFNHFRLFLEGDVLSWDREEWELRSPWNRSEMEILDLEKDICAGGNTGYFIVPQKNTFDESIHLCKKLSGSVMSYINQTQFEDVVHFASYDNILNIKECTEDSGDDVMIEFWSGGTDQDEEGSWITWDNNQPIEVIF